MSERLDEIEARANAATEGPWEAVPETRQAQASVIVSGTNRDWFEEWVAECGPTICNGLRDAEFIAHARTDVPALVTALRAVLHLADVADRGLPAVLPDDIRAAVDAALGPGPAHLNDTTRRVSVVDLGPPCLNTNQ